MKLFKRFVRDEKGLELSEYAIMCALIVLGLLIAIGALSGAISTAFQDTADEVNSRPAP